MGKVPGLCPVAGNGEQLSGRTLPEEDGDDGDVRTLVSHARTIYVEVPETDSLESVKLGEEAHVVLTYVLLEAVRALRPGEQRLGLRELIRVAVGGRRGRIAQALHSGVARCEEHVQCPGNIGVMCLERSLDRILHPRQRRAVKHAVHGAKRGMDALEICDVGLNELRAHRKVSPLSGRKVVKHPYAVTARDERLRDV